MHLNIGSSAVVGIVTAALVDQVPGKNGRVSSVGDIGDSILASSQGLNPVLVQTNGIWV